MRNVLARLEAEHDAKFKGPEGFPVAVGEVDMWTSPMGDGYLGYY